jgi:methyltransferase (TIGR00027 family)
VQEGEASVTARRVAAQRLTFARVPASDGDPAADDALAADVAGSAAGATGPMAPYLAARTAFFDRVVVGALDAGMAQVVIAAAGYDGRAWRYARPGVHWFEVDHPDTQRDKRARLERLDIDTGHVRFVPADFTVTAVGPALIAAGHDPATPSLFLLEGVAVSLDRPVLAAVLQGLRDVAAPGSRLAISLSVDTGTAAESERRARFQEAVAAVGEPARTVLTAADGDALLRAAGWASDPARAGSDKARRAGFVLASPR